MSLLSSRAEVRAFSTDAGRRIIRLVGTVDESLDREARYNARVAAFNQVIKNLVNPPRRISCTPKSTTGSFSTQGFVARQMDWNRRKSIGIEIERYRREHEKLESERRVSSRALRNRSTSTRNSNFGKSADMDRILENLNRVKALLENA